MAASTHLQLRDARDRLIDLLAIGRTYPLRDLPVRDEQLTVAFNTTAKLPIENSQSGVLYQLHDNGRAVEHTADGNRGAGVVIEAEGNGATLLLETYKIQDDITFQIYARKPVHEAAKQYRETYLHETATVKVGLDVSLAAWIQNAPFLDAAMETPPLTAARIVRYGATVEVVIQNSQEGVDYRLIHFQPAAGGKQAEVTISVATVVGNLHDITMRTQPLSEDIDIRIRATKTFDPSEQRATQTVLLDVVLPLKVRANPALPVVVAPSSIIDFNTPATLNIGNTQRSARYQIFVRTLRDREFIRRPDPDVITVPVEGAEAVHVQKPVGNEVWMTPDGFAAVGDAQAGTGGDLALALPPLIDNCLVIVQTQKDHQATQTISSALPLAQAAVILVGPNPAPPLRLRVWLTGAETNGDLQLFDGQVGVFYYFRRQPDGTELPLPAYFHKWDDQDARLNKGLGQLAVEVDFVVARPLASTAAPQNLTEAPPEPPLLVTGPLPTDTALPIRAVMAQTRVATLLNQPLQIPDGPAVAPESSAVDYGAKTRIRITASRAKESYQLFVDGTSIGDPVMGTGRDRLLDTGELRQDTTFELLIRPTDKPLVVERILRLPVLVRPNPALPARARDAVVESNGATVVQVETSQAGVRYQLLVGDQPLGPAVAGTGATIELPSGPLTTETAFVIRATRLAYPELFTLLNQQVTVQVQPAAGNT